jgi:hypothetical protein
VITAWFDQMPIERVLEVLDSSVPEEPAIGGVETRPSVSHAAPDSTAPVLGHFNRFTVDQARELLERQVRTRALEMISDPDEQRAVADLAKMSTRMGFDHLIEGARAALLLSRSMPRPFVEQVLALAVPQAATRFAHNQGYDFLMYVTNAVNNSFAESSTTDVNGRVVAMTFWSMLDLLESAPDSR